MADIDSGIFRQQGDPWQPGSASRYNAVSEMICSFGTTGSAALGTDGPTAAQGGAAGSILCKNVSETAIQAGSFVTISYPDYSSSDLYPDIYTMKPGVVDPCGVISDDCPPGETAEVRISGIVQAKLSPAPPDVLFIPGSPLQRDMGLVNLNSIGSDIYRNYFKVAAVGFNGSGVISKVRIYDGADPDSNVAGLTDVDSVSCTDLEHDFIPGTTIYLRLKVGMRSDGGEYFMHDFDINTVENSQEPMLCLAEISRSNKIIQRWTGGKVYWRNRFVIPYIRGYEK